MDITPETTASRLRETAASDIVSVEAFTALTEAIFISAGLTPDNARIAADAAVFPQLTGSESHGVVTMPLYLTGLVEGTIRTDPEFATEQKRPGAAVIDADAGLGLIAGHKAMSLACDLAAETGVGAVAVRRSSHFGAAGYYSHLAACSGMIGLAMSNSSPAIAPTGGVDALLGTNPIGAGVPLPGKPPMVLDMATATVARSRIRQSLAAGEPAIPEGWAIDRSGEPTTDAAEAIEGSVLPIGGPKGYGLALLVELLCSGLSDAEPGFSITYENVVSRPSGISHFFLAIDPAAFCGAEAFAARADHISDVIETSRPRPGGPAPRLPGARGQHMAEAVRKSGIAMHPNLRAALLKSAEILARIPTLAG
ncbi:MAG: Ldh family oxidoreductase [Rhodobiaceae bacterium]|nr:Ldh family oxidoreductase [Rhodobiaceae bacterium]